MRLSAINGLIARRRRPQAIAFGIALFLLFVLTVVVPATGPFDVAAFSTARGETRTGTVRAVEVERTPAGTSTAVMERFTVEADGELLEVERSYLADQIGIVVYAAGDRVLLTALGSGPDQRFAISDHARRGELLVLVGLFMVLVLVVGRWHGLGSLLGLAASALVIVRFVIPGILAGHDPVLIAIVGALVLVTTTLLLAHGPNLKTALAIASTAASLLLTGLFAGLLVRFLELGGLAHEEPAQLAILTDSAIDPQGLLLAGFVIGALGVLDDVTATQVSTVSELRSANPSLGRLELYRRAMNVGRDHVASTVNTLVLAYAGAALPLLLLIATQSEAIGVLLQRELIVTEVARTLAGSVGIVLAVPISTAAGALALGQSGAGDDRKPPASNR